MPSVGTILRQERENQNRSLSDVASLTRIRLQFLEAIERDQTAVLPGEFFYRSFVRNYANALDLNASTIEPEIEKLWPHQEIDPLPVLSGNYKVQRSEEDAAGRQRLSSTLSLLVLVLAACTGLFAFWQKIQPGESIEPRSVSASAVPQSPVETAPAVDTPAPPPVPEAAPATETKHVSLALEGIHATWVTVTGDGGKRVFSGLLGPGEKRSFEIGASARLLTGNAAGIDVQWKGKPIGPIGPSGQVRVVVFTPERFEILQPVRRAQNTPASPL